MQREITDKVKLTLYKKQPLQVISESWKFKSRERDKLMLREMDPTVSKNFIWYDKEMSTMEAVTNKQNDRAYALGSGDSQVNV